MRIMFIHNMSENLGIECLSSFLKGQGHEVRLEFDPWFMKADFFEAISALNKGSERFFNYLHRNNSANIKEKILDDLKSYKPDVVGFSLYTNNLLWAIDLAKSIKIISNADIVCGGPHTTTSVQKVMVNSCFDYAIVGEGEYAFLEFLDSKAKGLSLRKIKNLAFRDNGNIIVNDVRPYLYNLDILPMPDKKLFYDKVPQFRECYLVMTSRGCPFRCSYCINDAVQSLYKGHAGHIRLRSVENVINELKVLKGDRSVKAVFFEDDVFTINKKRLEEMMYHYRREVGIPFWCFVHPQTITKDIAKALKEGGCWMGNMGMQSGSDRIRNQVMKRRESVTEIANASRFLKDEGIKLAIDVILGSPTEDTEDLEKTADMLTTIQPDRLNTYWLTYYPKTSIIDLAIDDGRVDRKFVDNLEEGKESVLMSDGGTVRTNTALYKYYELLYIMLILFRASGNKAVLLRKIARALPLKSYFKRLFEFLIVLRNKDFKFFYLIKYIFAAKRIP